MMSSILVGVLIQTVAVFAEPGFPRPDEAGNLIEIPGAQVAESVIELSAMLEEVDVLVWRHGSMFPAELWTPLIAFLEGGGSLLHLGVAPFTRPVVGDANARVVQPHTVSLLKELRLNQSYRVEVGGARLSYGPGFAIEDRKLDADAWVSVLEPRFSDTKDFANEDGAPGARDAILRPLGFLHQPNGDSRFPVATASFAIDRLRGRFAGGRWVFHLISEPPTKEELSQLLREALRPPIDLRIDPTFGCFHSGERPSIILRVHRPLANDVLELATTLVVTRPDATTVRIQREIRVGRHASELIQLDVGDAPGLYRVTVGSKNMPPHETGFWIMDRDLFTSGDVLTMGSWSLLRNGRPEPVIGTTLMSGSVHRKFLFEPNAAEWDDTFRDLASLDINLVRTGVWSAYKKISLDANVVDEAFLRALEAYYLSARNHGIPILFTFFSFMPEDFGGESPYFDPRSIEGQRAYLAAIARRFSDAKEMFWDLINEPSFANPNKLWTCRPNGDRFEHKAFETWLRDRYSGSGDGRNWMDIVRARWRLLPDEAIGVPTEEDFADREVMGHHRPYRAKEYIHFAQDAFRDWIVAMTQAIRDAGSSAPITVGQDEGGLFDRPSPLYHHGVIDFTSIHTWWFNDTLIWDGVMAKARGKPMLVSESGIMQREHLSGESIRTPEGSAKLLERKIASAFSSGAFGLVQWCYQVNPYMASDNEVGIGIKRVDGSYKPELDVLRKFAGFLARNRESMANYMEPRDALVFPSSDHYSPRSFHADLTKRFLQSQSEGSHIQVVPEHRTSSDLGYPDVIILPACRGISDRAWLDLLDAVSKGSTLYAMGWFETDDAGLPAMRLGAEWQFLSANEVTTEAILPNASNARFDGAVFESWGRANYPPDDMADHSGNTRTTHLGKGTIIHNEIPLTWASDTLSWSNLGDFVRQSDGLTTRRHTFGEFGLAIWINDSGSRWTPPGVNLAIEPGRARMALYKNSAPEGSIDSTE